MRATYLDTPKRAYQGNTSIQKAIICSLMAVLSLVGVFLMPTMTALADEEDGVEEQPISITEIVLCHIFDQGDMYDSLVDLPFTLLSKSAYGAGIDHVDEGLNWMIQSGKEYSFKEINQRIVGYPLGVDVEQESESSPADKYNQGEKVNPYDRFGLAGLRWSAYGGEFKHRFSNLCARTLTESDANKFYEGRLDPRGTYWEISEGDPRSEMRYTMGTFSSISKTTETILSNWVFSITKFIVAMTITLISLAFSDPVSFLGLDDILGSDTGLFAQMYHGIFEPFIVLIFIFTGVYVMWNGLVRAQVRSAFMAAVRSVFLFLVAVVLALSPADAIKLPNNISVVAQAFILSSFSGSMTSGDGICATDVGAFTKELTTHSNFTDGSAEEAQSIITQSGETVKSVISCQLWKTFLFNPWVKGQFGAEFNELWANDKIASWAKSGATSLGNENDDMVGDAEVPMGGGEVINNWALFQISTQTDVHTPIGHPGERPQISNGFNNDWYRVVDAMSNYSETKREIDGGGTLYDPDGKPPHPGFQQWAGNAFLSRITIASSSILFASIGVFIPLVFAAMSSIYAVGLALLTALAPLMLLLGCWPGRGYEVFLGWLESIINTMMMRIATGILLVIAIMLTSSILSAIDEVGWWTTIASLCLLALLLFKSRRKLISTMASFSFASVPFSATASRVGDKFMRGAKATVGKTARIGATAAISGASSKRYGGSFFKGAGSGLKRELHNLGYRNAQYRKVAQTYEKFSSHKQAFASDNDDREQFDNDILARNKYCSQCGVVLTTDESGYFDGGIDGNGNLVCLYCRDSGDVPDVVPLYYRRQSEEEIKDERTKRGKTVRNERTHTTRNMHRTKSRIVLETPVPIADIPSMTPQQTPQALEGFAQALGNAVRNHELSTEAERVQAIAAGRSKQIVPPLEMPPELDPYIDKAMLSGAWVDKDYNYVIDIVSGAVERYVLESDVDKNEVVENVRNAGFDSIQDMVKVYADEQANRI